MDVRTRIEKRAVYSVGRWEVWAALTRPEELSRWFGSEVVSLDLRPGGRIVFRDADGGPHRALIEVVEAPARFAFRWLPAPVRAGSQRSPGSRVELLLEEVPGGTALTVVETPWVPLGDPVHPAPIVVGAPGSYPGSHPGSPPDPPGAPPRIMLEERVRVWG
jgi:uncharacterized protein YndB with AHSA1/START domain